MSRIKLLLLGLLVAVAVSAIGSASASAACGGSPPTHFVWCNDANPMEELGTPPVHVIGVSGLSLLAATISGVPTKFHCKKDDFLGVLELLGLGHGIIIFLECKMLEPEKCKLSEADEAKIQTTEFGEELVGTLAAGKAKAKFTGTGATEKFATLEVEAPAGCNVPAGNYEVTGLQEAELPESESMKVKHEVKATKALSKLKVGGNTASFSSTAEVELESKLAWGVLLGT